MSEQGLAQFRSMFGRDLSHDQIQAMITRFTQEEAVP